MKQLKNRVAVITGAGSGIGRATALRLAQEGCRLALSDIDESGLEETVKQIGSQSPKVTTHLVDASDKEGMRCFANEVAEAHQHIHIVVNNAGVALVGTLEENSLEDLEWL
ncbi:MAG: SDR family NAD(P)-dependent oxidoreductase, partial [Myxococcota bacterium]|nr:SDR family NAD(P)-dependent oxidoreductase [Myxococcota bacterium]